MATKDFGNRYFTKVGMPRGAWPPATLAVSNETEPPWRVGRGLAIRTTWIVVPLAAWAVIRELRRPRAWVLGTWGPPQTNELDARRRLLDATKARDDIAQRETIRQWRDSSTS